MMRGRLLGFLASCLLLPTDIALAHHSYAMFDGSGTSKVTGTVAKLEWQNPHALVGVYVRTPDKTDTYDLGVGGPGSPSVLQAHGWNKDSLKVGDKVEVEYWRLRDGSIGGHCEKFALSPAATGSVRIARAGTQR